MSWSWALVKKERLDWLHRVEAAYLKNERDEASRFRVLETQQHFRAIQNREMG